MHLFGGGQYIDTAVNVALENNCDIVIRTSDRFAGSFKTKNQQRVKIFCGNDLLELMDLGGWPGSEDLGFHSVRLGFCQGRLFHRLNTNYLTFITSCSLSLEVRVG